MIGDPSGTNPMRPSLREGWNENLRLGSLDGHMNRSSSKRGPSLRAGRLEQRSYDVLRVLCRYKLRRGSEGGQDCGSRILGAGLRIEDARLPCLDPRP